MATGSPVEAGDEYVLISSADSVVTTNISNYIAEVVYSDSAPANSSVKGIPLAVGDSLTKLDGFPDGNVYAKSLQAGRTCSLLASE